jgi:uncharacterized membrane protein
MEAYLLDWASLLLRWLHVVAGIVWIGTSFYFVALDNSLDPPRDGNPRVLGENWSIHGGGFYRKEKYRVAPQALPDKLHWFKWEAYWTWISGFALMVIVYYWHADTMLVDRAVYDLSAGAAVLISLALLVLAWVVYDALCRSPLGPDDRLLALAGFALLVLAIWLCHQLFGGRGAYIQIGAMVGTIMVANVAMVIIPGQRRTVAALLEGREPDPRHGRAGKQRSVHNNYLTLPVVFVMISGHYPMTYGHPQAWLILAAVFVVGALVRHFFNLRKRGRNLWWAPVAAVVMVATIALAIAPAAVLRPAGGERVTFAQAQQVLGQHCVACHAAAPTQAGFAQPPGGVMLETPEHIAKWVPKLLQQVVLAKVMPPGNLTGMTDEQRDLLARWIAQGAPLR